MMEALAMGDYGAYVWTSFALTATVLVICVVQARRRQKQALLQVQDSLDRQENKR
jgi:heme exporter protein CcmD